MNSKEFLDERIIKMIDQAENPEIISTTVLAKKQQISFVYDRDHPRRHEESGWNRKLSKNESV